MDSKFTLEELKNMTSEEYIKLILEMQADNVDHEIQNDLMLDLVKRYVQVSNMYESKLKEIERLSMIDPLTRVYNRLKFNKVGDLEIQRYERYRGSFSVLMLDIDHFKGVNDNFGHDIGDVTLVHFSEVVTKTLRTNDIFARWGGEEFVALLVECDKETAMMTAERVRKDIEEALFEQVEHITVSIGVAMVKHGDTLATMIKRADQALYNAKDTGRNKVVLAT